MKKDSPYNSHSDIVFSEQNLEKIFNNMLDPVVIYEIDDKNNFIKFVQVNKAFFTVYEYSEKELASLKFSMISAEKHKVSTFINRIEVEKKSLFQTVHITKSGRNFPVEVHSHSIEIDGIKAIVSTIRDITVRKKNEEKLLKLNESKDNILKIVSHDLRNPLAQIEGITQILRMEDIPPSLKEYLNIIDESRKHAETIVNELLSSSDMEGGDLNLSFHKMDVNNFCLKVVKHYTIFSKSKKCLDFNYSSPDKQVFILADEKRFTRVFDNIISNAVKFSFKDSKIDFRVAVKGNSVQFSVKDYGIGIPDELKDYIFDKGTRAKRKGTSGEKTIGLGMYIAKTIVELHNGKIWFETIANKGTTFYVTIPIIET